MAKYLLKSELFTPFISFCVYSPILALASIVSSISVAIILCLPFGASLFNIIPTVYGSQPIEQAALQIFRLWLLGNNSFEICFSKSTNNSGFLKNSVTFMVMKSKNFCFCSALFFITFEYSSSVFIPTLVIKLFILLLSCSGLYADKFIPNSLCTHL